MENRQLPLTFACPHPPTPIIYLIFNFFNLLKRIKEEEAGQLLFFKVWKIGNYPDLRIPRLSLPPPPPPPPPLKKEEEEIIKKK